MIIMSTTKKYVLLLKSQKDEEVEDEYEVILKSNGYDTRQVKTIDFKYVNLSKLKDKLQSPHNYSGIVFSSPRCVIAANLSLDDDAFSNAWMEKDNYVVGEATHKIALTLLNLNCLGKDSGNAEVLSQVMLKEQDKYNRSFLYPHGNLKMDILKTKFEGSNLNLDEIMVYETISNRNIKNDFEVMTENYCKLPEYIVFFSPSGVKAMEEVMQVIPIKLIKVIAIGPTTKMALQKAGIKVYKTAERPTPQDVLKVLLTDN